MKEYTAIELTKGLKGLLEDFANLCEAIPIETLSKKQAERIAKVAKRFRARHTATCETLRSASVERATKEH